MYPKVGDVANSVLESVGEDLLFNNRQKNKYLLRYFAEQNWGKHEIQQNIVSRNFDSFLKLFKNSRLFFFVCLQTYLSKGFRFFQIWILIWIRDYEAFGSLLAKKQTNVDIDSFDIQEPFVRAGVRARIQNCQRFPQRMIDLLKPTIEKKGKNICRRKILYNCCVH